MMSSRRKNMLSDKGKEKITRIEDKKAFWIRNGLENLVFIL